MKITISKTTAKKAMRYFADITKHLLFLLTLALVPISLTSYAFAIDDASKEGKLKAAYLFNFLRFVEWPDDFDGSIKLCIIGNKSDYHDSLLALTTQSVNNHAISVSIFNSANTNTKQELKNCQLIFITDIKERKESGILSDIKKLPILTVGENTNFTNHGGMINFIRAKDKISFEVNMIAVKKTDIRISSKILRLAKRVID